MTAPIDRRRPAGRLLAIVLALVLPAMPANADAYDDLVRTMKNPKISFGHDIDTEDKVWDFSKAVLESFKLGSANQEAMRQAVLAGVDYWSDLRKTQAAGKEPSAADFNRYVVKTMFEKVRGRDWRVISKTIIGSPAAAEIIKDAGVDVTEAIATSAPEGKLREVLEAATIASIDQICKPCAVARTAAVLAAIEGRKLRAAFEDERTRATYEAWKASGEPGQLPQGLLGGNAAYAAAREAINKALAEQGIKPLSEDDLEKAMLAKFAAWQRGEAVDRARAELLEKAKGAWQALKAADRGMFGTSDAEQVKAFGPAFIEAYEYLKRLCGDRPLPPNLIADAVALAVLKADPTRSIADWRNQVRDLASGYGWKDPFPGDPTTVGKRVRDRMSRLSHAKMEAVFDTLGIRKDYRIAYYSCLCSYVPHGMGVSFIYAPEGGKPCVSVGGFGTWHEGFPSVGTAHQMCSEAVRITPKVGAAETNLHDYVAGKITGKAY